MTENFSLETADDTPDQMHESRTISARNRASVFTMLSSDNQAEQDAAFQDLFNRHVSIVYKIAFQIVRDAHDAHDVVQETFLIAFRKLDHLRMASSFTSWIKTIARTTALNYVQRSVYKGGFKNLFDPDQMSNLCMIIDDPVDVLMQEENAEIIHHVIANLRPIYQEVLIAYYIQNNSLRHIQEHLNKPLGTIKRRLHKARLYFLEEINQLYPEFSLESCGDSLATSEVGEAHNP